MVPGWCRGRCAENFDVACDVQRKVELVKNSARWVVVLSSSTFAAPMSERTTACFRSRVCWERWNTMLRKLSLLALLSIGVTCSFLSGGRQCSVRTLGVEEMRGIFGGSAADRCCGEPTRCQLPNPNAACTTYNIDTACEVAKFWVNPRVNLNDCVIVVNYATCVTAGPNFACLGYYQCIWNPVTGCYQANMFFGVATTQQTCGDTCT